MYDKDNCIHKLKQSHKRELDLYKKELNYFEKFISENKIGLDFERFKEKEQSKNKVKIKNRNYDYELER